LHEKAAELADIASLSGTRQSGLPDVASQSLDDEAKSGSPPGAGNKYVPGDKSGLLALDRHKSTRIISAKDFAVLLA
jgi:hypothetical protein